MVSESNGGIASEDAQSFVLTDLILSGANDLPDDGETLTVDAIVIATTVIDTLSAAEGSVVDGTALTITFTQTPPILQSSSSCGRCNTFSLERQTGP